MLRLLILVLLLANLLYFAWSQGQLAGLGYAPATQSEPQRLQNQVKPAAVRVLSAQEAQVLNQPATSAAPTPSATASAANAFVCLAAGVFSPEQAARLRTALEQNLPTGSWALQDAAQAGRWLVYMGKYANAAAVQAKLQELRGLSIVAVPVQEAPALEPGVSLGEYDSAEAAQDKLQELTRRGVRTARVAQARAPVAGQRLVLAQVDEALRARLGALQSALAGKTLEACPA